MERREIWPMDINFNVEGISALILNASKELSPIIKDLCIKYNGLTITEKNYAITQAFIYMICGLVSTDPGTHDFKIVLSKAIVSALERNLSDTLRIDLSNVDIIRDDNVAEESGKFLH